MTDIAQSGIAHRPYSFICVANQPKSRANGCQMMRATSTLFRATVGQQASRLPQQMVLAVHRPNVMG